MSHEFGQSHDPAQTSVSQAARPLAPGRVSLTARLGANPALQRKQAATAAPIAPAAAAESASMHDVDPHILALHFGPPVSAVQCHGDRAPAAADTHAIAAEGVRGTGAPLPFLDELASSFGRHGGALTGVRAHTDASAATSARAIGADAYATGSDIAFAVAPTRELVGHEAAHVVQQRAGVALSGGVGAAGDPYERHADAVGAAFARGESVESLLTAGPQRGASDRATVQRREHAIDMAPVELSASGSVAEEYGGAADAGEEDRRASIEAKPPQELRISGQGQVAQAQRIIDEITSFQPSLMKGIRDGQIPTSALATNQRTIGSLEDLLASASDQAGSLSDFQIQYKQLHLDTARLNAKLTHFDESNPGLLEQGGLGDTAALAKQARKVAGSDAGATHFAALQQEHQETSDAAQGVGVAQNAMRGAGHDMLAKLNAVAAGVRSASPATEQPSELLQHAAQAKQVVNKAISLGTEYLGLPSQAAHAGKAIGLIIDDVMAGPMREFTALAEADAVKAKHAGQREQINELRAAVDRWHGATLAYRQAVARLEAAKTGERNEADLFSDAAEASGDPEVAIVAQLFGEADAAVAQCIAVQDLAAIEIHQGDNATADRRAVKGAGPKDHSLVYFEPVRTYTNSTRNFTDPRSVGFTFDAAKRYVLIFADDLAGPAGVTPTMIAATGELAELRATLEGWRDKLQAAMGMRTDRKTAGPKH